MKKLSILLIILSLLLFSCATSKEATVAEATVATAPSATPTVAPSAEEEKEEVTAVAATPSAAVVEEDVVFTLPGGEALKPNEVKLSGSNIYLVAESTISNPVAAVAYASITLRDESGVILAEYLESRKDTLFALTGYERSAENEKVADAIINEVSKIAFGTNLSLVDYRSANGTTYTVGAVDAALAEELLFSAISAVIDITGLEEQVRNIVGGIL